MHKKKEADIGELGKAQSYKFNPVDFLTGESRKRWIRDFGDGKEDEERR